MAAPAEGGDIIIRGGSAELQFDSAHFEKDINDSKKRRHDRARITRIEVSGAGDNDFTKSFPQGFKGTIRVSYEKI
jgi:hypothetical protein